MNVTLTTESILPVVACKPSQKEALSDEILFTGPHEKKVINNYKSLRVCYHMAIQLHHSKIEKQELEYLTKRQLFFLDY